MADPADPIDQDPTMIKVAMRLLRRVMGESEIILRDGGDMWHGLGMVEHSLVVQLPREVALTRDEVLLVHKLRCG